MKKGFSLVEILVVITIIGLLSATATISFERQRARSRDAKRIADVSNLGIGVEGYKAVKGTYPTDDVPSIHNGTDVKTSLVKLVENGLLNSLPTDPKPANIIVASETFCPNYTYRSYRTGSTSVVPSISNALYSGYSSIYGDIGNRAYTVYFATETAGDNWQHPLNKDIPATNGIDFCGAERGYAYLLGPRI